MTIQITVSKKNTSYYLKAGSKPPVRLGTLRRLAEKVEDIEAEVGTVEVAGDADLLAALEVERQGLATADDDRIESERQASQQLEGELRQAYQRIGDMRDLPDEALCREPVVESEPARCQKCGVETLAGMSVCVGCELVVGLDDAGLEDDRCAADGTHECMAHATGAASWQPCGAGSVDPNDSLATIEPAAARDPRLPDVGSVIVVDHKGTHGGHWEIVVEADGFTWNGTHYKSLSGVAKAATGMGLNGFLWAGLTKRTGAAPAAEQTTTKKAQREAAKKLEATVRAVAAAWLQTNLASGCAILDGTGSEATEAEAVAAMRTLIGKLVQA